MLYTMQLPTPCTDIARAIAYFQGKGYNVGDAASLNGDGTVAIDLDRDPTADVPGYTDAPTPAQTQLANAKAAARTYLQSLRAIAPANRTPQQTFELALALIVRDLAQAGG